MYPSRPEGKRILRFGQVLTKVLVELVDYHVITRISSTPALSYIVALTSIPCSTIKKHSNDLKLITSSLS